MAWFRVEEEIEEDDRIVELLAVHGSRVPWAFIVFMSQAKKQEEDHDRRGRVRIRWSKLERKFGLSPYEKDSAGERAVVGIVGLLEAEGLVQRLDSSDSHYADVWLPRWERYQPADPTGKYRQRRRRAAMSRDSRGTVPGPSADTRAGGRRRKTGPEKPDAEAAAWEAWAQVHVPELAPSWVASVCRGKWDIAAQPGGPDPAAVRRLYAERNPHLAPKAAA